MLGRRHKILLAALALTAVTGTAWAFLSSAGSASTNGTQTVARTVTIAGGAATQNLLPTGSATGDVTVTLQNATTSPLRATTLVLDTARGTGGYSSNAAGCFVTWALPGGGGPWTVNAGSTLPISLPNSVTMGASAPDSCQGQTFTIYLKVA